MGLAFTIDSPIKVARFGIDSVMSIVEYNLLEMARDQYSPIVNEQFIPIGKNEEDYRAKRVTAYLNLVQKIVSTQINKIKNEEFTAGSEIVKYFEMLPDNSNLKKTYLEFNKTVDLSRKLKLEKYLRSQIVAGKIDVNIMTKVDRDNLDKDGIKIEDGSDAVSALRGYAQSNLQNTSVVFSAGMNLRLFNSLENFTCFDINSNKYKKITIKVSDYRSAFIQGKILAKKGFWVSEFRIESGLNCGGHAFATDGYLLGPILEEFKINRQFLIDTLFEIYQKVKFDKFGSFIKIQPEIKFSVQGGIGTYEEDTFLKENYNIDSTGWGTPFLLVPEATTVDSETLKLLCEASEDNIFLSKKSPLGIRFYFLKGTSSEKKRLERIEKGSPGSPCLEKHLAFNKEFTDEPICTASKKYQRLKLDQLRSLKLSEKEFEKKSEEIIDKECLCIGLSNSASIVYNKVILKNSSEVNICPGPNIINFSKVVSLQKMTDHIYVYVPIELCTRIPIENGTT
jgi:hypothetical protein